MAANNNRQEIAELQERIRRARWRLRMASLGGPEWDAATELLGELELELDTLRRGKARSTAANAAE
ncbi:MAG: hypothetical protein M3R57_10565 [Chloroflexota bacterium]|nr:hypothetical protein [Chloroflexota bacterium]